MSRDLRSRIWKPLDSTEPTIRLLRLSGAVPEYGQPLVGSLEIHPLDGYQRYNAISWAWGAPGFMSSIVIDGTHGWRIPSKLDMCLRYLCQKTDQRLFWVDAVCVHQFNIDERAQQVRLMQKIFFNAHTVYVWLGSEQNSLHWLPDRLWGNLPELSTFQGGDEEARRFLTGRRAGSILLRDWWRRVWPMQEVILARDLKLCDGDDIVDLTSLRALVSSTRLSLPQLDDLFWLADFRSCVNHDADGKCGQFAILLHKSRLRDTSDARDKVYGLLGVCTFLFDRDFLEPDYKQPVSTVYVQLASRLVEKTKSLAFLNQVTPLHHTDASIPNWVPDLASKYNHKPECSRISNWKLYGASRSIKGSSPLCQKQAVSQDRVRCLRCDGNEFGIVTKASAACETPNMLVGIEALRWYGAIIFSWFDQYQIWTQGFQGETGQRRKFVSTIFRSINGNRQIFLSDDEAWIDFFDLCRLLMQGDLQTEAGQKLQQAIDNAENGWIRRMINVMMQQNPVETAEEDYHSGVSHWWRRCYESIEESRFFMTDNGRIGIGPVDTQEGDSVAVLRGGNVPYMLRRRSKWDHLFVGECFVYGAMQGEIGRNREPISAFYLY